MLYGIVVVSGYCRPLATHSVYSSKRYY